MCHGGIVGGQVGGIGMLWPRIWWSHERFRDSFDETGILQEFIGILDNVDPVLVIAERYRGLPPILVRTFVYDSVSRLDDFVRECRGCVGGKVMNYVCEELRSLLYEVLEEGDDAGGE
jgi:hypothetical protein